MNYGNTIFWYVCVRLWFFLLFFIIIIIIIIIIHFVHLSFWWQILALQRIPLEGEEKARYT